MNGSYEEIEKRQLFSLRTDEKGTGSIQIIINNAPKDFRFGESSTTSYIYTERKIQ